jgi:hypothetical protein
VKKRKKPPASKLEQRKSTAPALPASLPDDVRTLIEQARGATARAVNSALVLLYWSVGDRIRRDVLKGKHADYGNRLVSSTTAPA